MIYINIQKTQVRNKENQTYHIMSLVCDIKKKREH